MSVSRTADVCARLLVSEEKQPARESTRISRLSRSKYRLELQEGAGHEFGPLLTPLAQRESETTTTTKKRGTVI